MKSVMRHVKLLGDMVSPISSYAEYEYFFSLIIVRGGPADCW